MKVKSFWSNVLEDLEKDINKFIEKEHIDILYISHSSMVEDEVEIYSALVLYKKRIDCQVVTFNDLEKEAREYDRAQTAKD